jgi:hypothetical protein
MDELVINLHMHTPYSDGTGTHREIAQAAMKCGLDAVIVTDHNIWVNGPEDYYQEGDRKVLLLVGEEIHDQGRNPQKNHMLVFGARRELATYAYDPQRLLNAVNQAGGLAFIAHPDDPAAPAIGETDITWVDWQVHGYTGIELWNGFSELKARLKSKLHAIYYAYNPEQIARGPQPETLQKWDELLRAGKRVVALGGSDAHALKLSLGPLHRTVFPYEFHFRGVNNHLLVNKPLNGDPLEDANLIYDTLRRGNLYTGYDLPASTRGFRFNAQGSEQVVVMGDEIPAKGGVTLQIKLPMRAECVLLKDGKPLKTWTKRDLCTHITNEPGVYRVEVFIYYKGRRRGWIYSNPIYVR